ncbi:MAG: hypothetical protein GY807_06920 [Gammaproteobacteria bacterium]|nr:hypothetical protein [Gammaproteobacteria bacterium]
MLFKTKYPIEGRCSVSAALSNSIGGAVVAPLSLSELIAEHTATVTDTAQLYRQIHAAKKARHRKERSWIDSLIDERFDFLECHKHALALAIAEYPCRTPKDVRAKASFFAGLHSMDISLHRYVGPLLLSLEAVEVRANGKA